MPILTRPLEATDNASMHLVAVSRHDGVAGGIDPSPLTDLPPSIGAPTAAPAAVLAAVLTAVPAADALRLLPWLADARRRPTTWAHPSFGLRMTPFVRGVPGSPGCDPGYVALWNIFSIASAASSAASMAFSSSR